jgi:hypothetical protein
VSGINITQPSTNPVVSVEKNDYYVNLSSNDSVVRFNINTEHGSDKIS